MLTGVVFSAIVVGSTLSMIWGAITYWMSKKYGNESAQIIAWLLISFIGVGIPSLLAVDQPATYWRIVLMTVSGMGAGFCIVYGATYAATNPAFPLPWKLFYIIGSAWVVGMMIIGPNLLIAR